ncbi:MAG TPA: hybrid sensor histidine kinase/response regulator [Ghiorsea sp.]|nr:hybrid sensor histidine kinase/response regulator [Ghiorsea sp.]
MSGFDLSNFIASFFDEARERLSSINQALVAFEAGTLDDEGLVSLRRDAHTIKGSALMLGVNDVGAVAHVFEDLVELLIESPELRTDKATQFMYDLHDALDKRLEDPDSQDLLDEKEITAKFDALLISLKSSNESDASNPQDAQSEADETEILSDSMHVMIGAEEVKERKEKLKAETLENEVFSEKHLSQEELNQLLSSPASATAVTTISEAPVNDDLESSTYRPVIQRSENKASGQRKSSGRFLRVDAERMQALSNQVVEISTEQNRSKKVESDLQSARVDLRTLRREWRKIRYLLDEQGDGKEASTIDYMIDVQMRHLRRMTEEARYHGERNGFVLRELRDQVLGLMVRPLDSVFSTFPRAVRDVATKAGKNVRLVVDGSSVEMDQNVTESLVEPLVHLLNNAVAHGIESPETRASAGKPAQGQVSIIAKQSGSEVVIEVMDDGQGIDAEVIKKVAVERGVTTQDEINLMNAGEVMELIFRPGFSTLAEVDTLAGRGIGMNVVQDAVRRLTGTIRVYTEVGKGTRFVISVPISIAVQDALMFKIGGQKYGMLTHMIDQALPLSAHKMQSGQAGKQFIQYGKEHVPLVDLRRMMLIKGEQLSDDPFVIIAEHIEGFVGIVVDEMLGEGEIMVRDLDPYIKRYLPQGLMGNTIVEDGSVVMLLEPYGIKEMGRTAPDQDLEVSLSEEEKLHFNVLLVDDSLIAREVEKNIFENLGFVVDTAIDGMDGLEKLQTGHYDMLVTDLEMPRLDGFGLVRQIRNQVAYEDLPIIVISTRESAEDRMRALEVGADSYMVKQHLEASNIISTVKALVGPDMVKERGVKQQLDQTK